MLLMLLLWTEPHEQHALRSEYKTSEPTMAPGLLTQVYHPESSNVDPEAWKEGVNHGNR